jgi:hypothetical protein
MLGLALLSGRCGQSQSFLSFADFDEGGMRTEGWHRLRSRPRDHIGGLVF